MARIIPKLDLNRTPQLAENYGLVCAKNIRVLKDGTIGPDTGVIGTSFSYFKDKAVDNLIDKLKNLDIQIDECISRLDEVNAQLADAGTGESIFKEYITSKDFSEFEHYANPVTIDNMLDPNNDYFCEFINTPGEGLSKTNPKIIDTKFTNEAAFVTYLKELNGTPQRITSLLFPATVIHADLIKRKGDPNNHNIARVIENINNFGQERLDYYLKLASNHFDFWYSHFMNNDDVSVADDEYVIDRYVLLYTIAFFEFWADASDSNGFIQMLDSAKAQDITNYDLLNEKTILENTLQELTDNKNELLALYNKLDYFDDRDNNYSIAAIIPYNTCYYILAKDKDNASIILEVIEGGEVTCCNCNWNWSGGTVSGVCTLNLRNEKLLVIAESKSGALIPLKTINLNKSSINDIESIYTQTPEIPLMQFKFGGYYPAKISPGIYQFFVRYEISEDTYTNWFPVSRPLYTARHITLNTNQGTLKYVDAEIDSDKGFVLNVNWVYYRTIAVKNSYKRFQLGFLHSSKEGVVARSWKHFDNDVETIYFDRAEDYIEEIEVKDLTSSIYGLYNVENITYFKNKLYVSNYTETDFNPKDLEYFASSVKVSIKTVSKDNINVVTNETLVPYQTYAFYIHFVKNTGEFTNGYKIGDDITIDDTIDSIYNDCTPWSSGANTILISTCDKLIYPVFTFKKSLPEGYVACFISIKRIKGKTMQLFNIYGPYGNDRQRADYRVFGDCLELDTLLESVVSDIPVVGKHPYYDNDYRVYEGKGTYNPSYDPSDFYTFGSTGKVAFKFEPYDSHPTEGSANRFITLDYEASKDNLLLERCTPLIRVVTNYTFDDINNIYLGGYLCDVTKPNASEYDTYVAGNDWYLKSSESQGKIALTKIDNLSNIEGTCISDVNRIYSNYNLEYMSITETITPKIVSGLDTMVLSINSLTLSSIYELKKMFFDYTKKLYNTYIVNKNAITFNNTIRSSNIIGDEDSINIYKFEADEYYNVPVDKGIITNLKAIGNAILVHTQDSLYRFIGNNSLSANGGEDVQLSETDVFDTGITQVFGSEYGFGGLKKKEHSIVTENSYVFYDADSNNFYLIKGQGELSVISNNIRKLLDSSRIDDVKFASDYYNDRIFVYIKFTVSKYITLSYNFKVGGFVSLHDFVFDKAFNTKVNCYFIRNNQIYRKNLVFEENNTNKELNAVSNFYPTFYKIVNNVNVSRPYLDIIINESYESNKVANYINYICNKINLFSTSFEAVADGSEAVIPLASCNVAQETLEKYMIYAIQLYTDRAASKVMLATYNDNYDDIPENQRVLYENLYPANKPYFDKGRWNFNYFRNSLDANNKTDSDNMSLIYGHYFVVRLIFDPYTNFKLENLNLDYNIKV